MNYRLIEAQKQLKDSLELLKTIFGPDLLGVYLYGSSLVGGLQRYSDIDLLVVINRKTTSKEKAVLIDNFLQISGIYMKSSKLPLEVTLVEKAAINPWCYPPHVDFQYGEWLRTAFEEGTIEPCQTNEMPDLALIVTQVLLKSQTLWGSDPEQLLSRVPYHDFINAMLHDLDRLFAEIESDTRNVLLTFARIWSTLETSEIRPKPAAADWAINHLAKNYQPVMKRAKSICIGEEDEHWDDIEKLVKPCADFMMGKIRTQAALIDYDDQSNAIKLAVEPLIIVRSYEEQDTEGLAKIYYYTIHNINCRDYSKEQLDVWAPKTSLQPEGWLKKFQRTKPFVATANGQVVGFVEFERNGHIDCFYCHHDWIGKGVGSALLKVINEKALEYNLDKIFAEVSITAKPFFERNGFKVIREQEVERKGIKLINFQMEKGFRDEC
ncbi:MAG: aminoglycoside adenylyltransferase family protein [Waddliaceae bacterium]